MKRIFLITIFMMGLFLSNDLIGQELKGPKYKNASISERYKGNSNVIVSVKPNDDIKSYEYKNRKKQLNDSTKIINLKNSESKHTMDLKSYEFKNYRLKK